MPGGGFDWLGEGIGNGGGLELWTGGGVYEDGGALLLEEQGVQSNPMF